MKKKTVLFFLVWFLQFIPLAAQAGVGDFLYQFGVGSFYRANGMAIDSSGNTYVVDQSNKVQVFNSAGVLIRQWGSLGYGDGQFYYPRGIAVDANGNVYVSDSCSVCGMARVQIFTNNGTFLRTLGGTASMEQGQFWSPNGIAVDADGNVYVADGAANPPGYPARVLVFSNTGAFIREWGTMGSGDGQFNCPYGIALDSNGNVYVTEIYNSGRVQVFSNTGTFLRKWTTGGYPKFITVDRAGQVYVTNYGLQAVQLFSSTGTLVAKWGTYGTDYGQFINPAGIVLDSSANVYVADEYIDGNSGRVQVFRGPCVLAANAGSDQILEQTSPSGASVTLDGSGTTQQGCTGGLTYTWSWLGSSATGTNPTVLMPAGTTNVTLTVSCIDSAATPTDTVVITVQDTQKPDTTSIVSGIGGMNGWYVSDALISLSASDLGSGVKEIHYSIDGTETIVPASTTSFTLSTDGIHSITYHAKDNADNSEAAHPVTIRIDKTSPAIMATANSAPNANGWYNADVTVTFTCSDTVSGISSCASQRIVTTEGAGQIITGTAVDMAGLASAASVTLSIDKTPPAIAITGIANGQTYILGGVPTAGYTVTDNTSGVATQSATLTGGYANGLGTFTYTVNAMDNAGNAASASATFSVVYGFSGFLEPISLGKPFKLGSTIPVKFRLTDAQGNYISTALATIAVQQFSGEDPIGDPIILSANGADSGNVFRYDAAANLYIFNFGTKDLVQGTWQIRATLDDGTVKSVFIQLKKN